jgi:hypothetical protein
LGAIIDVIDFVIGDAAIRADAIAGRKGGEITVREAGATTRVSRTTVRCGALLT